MHDTSTPPLPRLARGTHWRCCQNQTNEAFPLHSSSQSGLDTAVSARSGFAEAPTHKKRRENKRLKEMGEGGGEARGETAQLALLIQCSYNERFCLCSHSCPFLLFFGPLCPCLLLYYDNRSDTMEQFLRCMLMPDTAIEAQVNILYARSYTEDVYIYIFWGGERGV